MEPQARPSEQKGSPEPQDGRRQERPEKAIIQLKEESMAPGAQGTIPHSQNINLLPQQSSEDRPASQDHTGDFQARAYKVTKGEWVPWHKSAPDRCP